MQYWGHLYLGLDETQKTLGQLLTNTCRDSQTHNCIWLHHIISPTRTLSYLFLQHLFANRLLQQGLISTETSTCTSRLCPHRIS